jgi:hypothetical protein
MPGTPDPARSRQETTTVELESDIGHALATDYFLLREEFSPQQLDYLQRTRAFVHDEVLPVINDYGSAPRSPGWSATASRATAARR